MYITKVFLQNVRCFREATLNLESQGKPTMWTVVVGDNGDGKTTLLRSIAMGLCDESSAAGLHRELAEDFVRTEEEEATVMIELADSTGPRFTLVTRVTSFDAFEGVRQEFHHRDLESVKKDPKPGTRKHMPPLDDTDFPWGRIFACGYGAGGRLQATTDYSHYLAVDALYPLFNYAAGLHNPELAWRRLLDHAHEHPGHHTPAKAKREANKWVVKLLGSVLMLEPACRIRLTSRGIEVGKPHQSIPLRALGDGHRATVTWVLDLLSWWLAHSREREQPVTGIVLVDELEQHLHPTWQRAIVQLLSDQFPRIQFIATTHSALCAAGIADLSRESAQIAVARRNACGTAELTDEPTLAGWTGSLLTQSPCRSH